MTPVAEKYFLSNAVLNSCSILNLNILRYFEQLTTFHYLLQDSFLICDLITKCLNDMSDKTHTAS